MTRKKKVDYSKPRKNWSSARTKVKKNFHCLHLIPADKTHKLEIGGFMIDFIFRTSLMVQKISINLA